MTPYWTLMFPQGRWTHAARDRDSYWTFCGRRTDLAVWWDPPGSEPGCKVCYRVVMSR